MYSIVAADGREIGIVETPVYIFKQSNGVYALCDEAVAEGIAFEGTPYQLVERPAMGDGLIAVRLFEVDAGSRLSVQEKLTLQNSANIDYISMMADIILPNEFEEVSFDA